MVTYDRSKLRYIDSYLHVMACNFSATVNYTRKMFLALTSNCLFCRQQCYLGVILEIADKIKNYLFVFFLTFFGRKKRFLSSLCSTRQSKWINKLVCCITLG